MISLIPEKVGPQSRSHRQRDPGPTFSGTEGLRPDR